MLKISYELSMQPSVEDVLANEGCSFWLKNTLQAALNRDCLDAIRDIEVIHSILHARIQRLGITK